MMLPVCRYYRCTVLTQVPLQRVHTRCAGLFTVCTRYAGPLTVGTPWSASPLTVGARCAGLLTVCTRCAGPPHCGYMAGPLTAGMVHRSPHCGHTVCRSLLGAHSTFTNSSSVAPENSGTFKFGSNFFVSFGYSASLPSSSWCP